MHVLPVLVAWCESAEGGVEWVRCRKSWVFALLVKTQDQWSLVTIDDDAKVEAAMVERRTTPPTIKAIDPLQWWKQVSSFYAALGKSVIRLSLAYFYTLGNALAPLPHLVASSLVRDAWAPLHRAQTELESLLSTSWLAPAVKAASAHGIALHSAIQAVTNRTDFDSEVGFSQASAITSALTSFDMVVRSELYIADAYFVTRKAAYDTNVLIVNAEQQFPVTLGVKVPNAIVDVREAGKCLAFELSTAAGFHLFRAVESVVRAYWSVVGKNFPPPKLKSLGSYVAAMEKHDVGDKKVRAVLIQLKELHRNPLAHPEETLKLDDAISLFGMCQSAISAMLKEIPDATSSALGSMA